MKPVRLLLLLHRLANCGEKHVKNLTTMLISLQAIKIDIQA